MVGASMATAFTPFPMSDGVYERLRKQEPSPSNGGTNINYSLNHLFENHMKKTYLLMKNGFVQHSEQNGEQVMLVFVNYDEARRYADRHGATVAEVGSVKGETLLLHVEAAEQRGFRTAIVADGMLHFLERAKRKDAVDGQQRIRGIK
jgi:hypothetical protein